MAAPELATAVQHGANIVVCVFDNGAYGTIRMHQEMPIRAGSAAPICPIPTSS
jgi:thiamine pyrophosphate-dependent acetolactate synthase large subunit-like protein